MKVFFNWPNPLFLKALLLGLCLANQALSAESITFEKYLVIPVRVHLLQSSEPKLATTLTNADITRVFAKANKVWAQAGVVLTVDSIIAEPAAKQEVFAKNIESQRLDWLLQLRPEDSRPTNFFHVYYVKTMPPNGVYFPGGIFVKDTASLRKVEGGIDEPLPRVTSHEFGHCTRSSATKATRNCSHMGQSDATGCTEKRPPSGSPHRACAKLQSQPDAIASPTPTKWPFSTKKPKSRSSPGRQNPCDASRGTSRSSTTKGTETTANHIAYDITHLATT